VLQAIRLAGHSVGNHTFHHLNGRKTPTAAYLQNIASADEGLHTRLFRPPYGRITRAQAAALRLQGYQVVMWTGLTGDFDTALLPHTCAATATRLCKAGSLLVLHDSEKAELRLQKALPAMLSFMQNEWLLSKALREWV
jgi:peptidoglycan/xylan/chitin deacetylase (PgdA/CDA1 family)